MCLKDISPSILQEGFSSYGGPWAAYRKGAPDLVPPFQPQQLCFYESALLIGFSVKLHLKKTLGCLKKKKKLESHHCHSFYSFKSCFYSYTHLAYVTTVFYILTQLYFLMKIPLNSGFRNDFLIYFMKSWCEQLVCACLWLGPLCTSHISW